MRGWHASGVQFNQDLASLEMSVVDEANSRVIVGFRAVEVGDGLISAWCAGNPIIQHRPATPYFS